MASGEGRALAASLPATLLARPDVVAVRPPRRQVDPRPRVAPVLGGGAGAVRRVRVADPPRRPLRVEAVDDSGERVSALARPASSSPDRACPRRAAGPCAVERVTRREEGESSVTPKALPNLALCRGHLGRRSPIPSVTVTVSAGQATESTFGESRRSPEPQRPGNLAVVRI